MGGAPVPRPAQHWAKSACLSSCSLQSFSFPRIPNEFSIKKFLVNHHYQHYLSLVPSPQFHFLFLGSSSQAQCELWPLSVSFRNVIFSRTFSVPFFRCVDFLEQHRTKDFHLQALVMYGYHITNITCPNRPDAVLLRTLSRGIVSTTLDRHFSEYPHACRSWYSLGWSRNSPHF